MACSRPSTTPTPLSHLAGQRGLFIGVGGEHSTAWRCAQRMASLGATLAWSGTTHGPARPALRLGTALRPCDLHDAEAVRAVVAQAAAQLGGFDFVVHATPQATGAARADHRTHDTSEGFVRAMRMVCMSFAETARLCVPHMPHGGVIVSLHRGGAEPPAVASVRDSILRYLALELEPRSIRVLGLSPGAPAARAPWAAGREPPQPRPGWRQPLVPAPAAAALAAQSGPAPR